MKRLRSKTDANGLARYAAVMVTVVALAAGPVTAGELFTPDETKGIEEIVRDYIMKNPGIILDAVETLNKRQEEAADEQIRRIILSRKEEIFKDPATPVGGNPRGDVTIVEFFDYQCGYCKRVFPRLKELLANDGNIRFVFKEFPILGPKSVFAAQAALAAWRQDKEKYVRFHDALMLSKGSLSKAKVFRFATDSGLDIDRLKVEMEDTSIKQIIGETLDLASALNINGTPAFVIGDTVVPGAVDIATLRSLVERARKAEFNNLL